MNHQLTIVPAYRDMSDYVSAVQANPGADPAQLWQEIVVDRRWSEWGADQFNAERTRQHVSKPVADLSALANKIALVAGSPLEQVIRDAYTEISAVLPPQLDRAVCVWVNPGVPHDLHGVLGSCVGDNILLEIDPTGDWLDWVPYVLAHECHHSWWGYEYFGEQGKRRHVLATALVNEGEADTFAHMLFPNLDVPWVDALTADQERQQWAAIKPLLTSSDPADYMRFIFGNSADVPRHTGYTIGFRIAQSFLRRHPDMAVADWSRFDPEELIAQSGYEPGSGQ